MWLRPTGINADSIWQMNLGLEQLTAVMLGGDSVEVKAVIAADLLVLQPIREQVVTGVKVEPLDMQKLQQMPGIVGYIVQPGDSLWKIAKKFHTTVDNIKETNGLTEDEIRPGDKLVLIKRDSVKQVRTQPVRPADGVVGRGISLSSRGDCRGVGLRAKIKSTEHTPAL